MGFKEYQQVINSKSSDADYQELLASAYEMSNRLNLKNDSVPSHPLSSKEIYTLLMLKNAKQDYPEALLSTI